MVSLLLATKPMTDDYKFRLFKHTTVSMWLTGFTGKMARLKFCFKYLSSWNKKLPGMYDECICLETGTSSCSVVCQG